MSLLIFTLEGFLPHGIHIEVLDDPIPELSLFIGLMGLVDVYLAEIDTLELVLVEYYRHGFLYIFYPSKEVIDL